MLPECAEAFKLARMDAVNVILALIGLCGSAIGAYAIASRRR